MAEDDERWGRIEAHMENQTGWLRSIDGKLDEHLTTPHADVADVKANTRGRFMVIGAIALLSILGTVLAMV